MANWCDNEVVIVFSDDAEFHKVIEIIGEVQDHIGFKSEEERVVGLFDRFIPTPEGKLADEGWYGWRIENWGTKWNPQIHDIMMGCNTITIRFSSAWSPPQAFFTKFTEMYQSTEAYLTYVEEGMGYCGKARYAKGEELADAYINQIPTEMYVDLGYKLGKNGFVENADDTEDIWNILDDPERFDKFYWLALEKENS